MMRIPLSPAASGLLRALLGRCGVNRDRILLTEFRSTDWQSLTFIGERHQIRLRVPGPHAEAIADAMTEGLADADFVIPGHVVADIAVADRRSDTVDASILLEIEALTIAE